MPSCSKNDVVLVRYPFVDGTHAKIRPAVIVSAPHASSDLFVVPLTSKIAVLSGGEFLLNEWAQAGLHVPTAVKRGIFTLDAALVLKRLGALVNADVETLDESIRNWLGLT